jgi:hypothetical protein
VRERQLYLNPQAEHLLDWFHVAMRLTVLQQTAKGLPQTTSDDEGTYQIREPVRRSLERLKWFWGYGNVHQALQVVQSAVMDLQVAVATSGDGTARKLLKAVEEFHTYIENNCTRLWRRHGILLLLSSLPLGWLSWKIVSIIAQSPVLYCQLFGLMARRR